MIILKNKDKGYQLDLTGIQNKVIKLIYGSSNSKGSSSIHTVVRSILIKPQDYKIQREKTGDKIMKYITKGIALDFKVVIDNTDNCLRYSDILDIIRMFEEAHYSEDHVKFGTIKYTILNVSDDIISKINNSQLVSKCNFYKNYTDKIDFQNIIISLLSIKDIENLSVLYKNPKLNIIVKIDKKELLLNNIFIQILKDTYLNSKNYSRIMLMPVSLNAFIKGEWKYLYNPVYLEDSIECKNDECMFSEYCMFNTQTSVRKCIYYQFINKYYSKLMKIEENRLI